MSALTSRPLNALGLLWEETEFGEADTSLEIEPPSPAASGDEAGTASPGTGESHPADTAPAAVPLYRVSGGRVTLASEILDGALARFRRPDGYEGCLVEAAWQLEEMGRAAWPALRGLIRGRAPESDYFLKAAVHLEGVESRERRQVLVFAARFGDINARSRLLELLEEMPREVRDKVLRALAAEGAPDDSVTDRARELLSEPSS